MKALAEIVGRSIKEHVAAALKPVEDRIAELDERVAHIIRTPGPAGKDGRDGVDGKDGVHGKDGRDGADGKDGKDGATLHPDTVELMVRNAAEKVAAALPKPKDGTDGFGLEDFDLALAEDGRTLRFKFQRGDLVVERAIRIPTCQYRNVWKDGDEYFRGDFATWGGSVWHCNVDGARSKPDAGNGEWTLAVKRGANGKDARGVPS